MTGTVLEEKYRLVRVLGSGAMAHVYEAEQLRLGRSVAVKMLRGNLAQDRKALERFRTEGLAASRINHPHAIAIFDLGVTRDGTPYLVMEHLRGRTLAQVLQERPLSPERTAAIGAQILSALEEAHGCGVIHRDLKADNVVVEPRRDGSDFVKVLDFGIASFVDRPDTSIVGTPEYMSPEAIRGAAPSPSMDIYSMGILLYEMIVGRTPFAGLTSITTLLGKHLGEAPRPPHEVVPSCPRSLSDVVLKSLEKEAGKRYGGAADMRHALLGALGDASKSCKSCGEPLLRGVRFCTSCGVETTTATMNVVPEVPEAHEAPPPVRSTLSFGSEAAPRVRPEKRPSRLTNELAAAIAATQQMPEDAPTRTSKVDELIGRDDELARIHRFVEGSDASCALTILGPHGVGKARLVIEAGRRLGEGSVMFVAGPDPTGLQLPWYPVLSMIEAVLGLQPRPSYEELVLGVARVGLPERDAPGLAELFGLEGPLAAMELAVRRRETYAAALRALSAVGRRHHKPVLAFVDVDRYDQPSRKLVETLALMMASPARMIITTSSPDAAPSGTALLTIVGLGPEDSHTLLVRHAGGERGELLGVAELHKLSEGNPAAIQHIAGWLAMGNDPADIPPRMADLVAARLSALPAPARRLLQAIAAHGQVAARANLGAVLADIDPTGFALATLERTGLVTTSEHDITIPMELVAQVAESCTPADVRRALAGAVLDDAPDDLPLAAVAHYAEACDDLEKALGAFIAAGDDAVRRFDDKSAGTLYHRAITIARRMQAAADPRAGARLVGLSIRLADVLRHQGELALAAGTLDEAELFGPTPAQLAGIARGRGRIALKQDDPLHAATLFRRAIGIGFRACDAGFLCETYIDLATTLASLGNVAEAAAELGEAVDALTLGEGLARAEGPERLWLLGLQLAQMLLKAKNLPAAKQAARDALAQAEKCGSTTGIGRMHALLAQILEVAGDTHGALVHQAQALDHMRRLGDRRSTAELLLACARMTGDLPPVVARDSDRARQASRRSRDTVKKALEVAHELATEIGWEEGVKQATGEG